MKAAGMTDKGLVRDNNEDAYALYNEAVGALPNLYVVADGMGGHQCGEVASSKAIEYFLSFIKENDQTDIMDTITEGVRNANRQVHELSKSDPSYYGMGTTFTACVVKDGRGYTAHVGDSRLYLIRKGELHLITTDHTYVNEMVKAGQITKEEAKVHPSRNALTKALGVDSYIEIDGYIFDICDKDKILMCSDGLTNMVSESDILKIADSDSDLVDCARKLIEAANENGGIDNITVLLAETGR